MVGALLGAMPVAAAQPRVGTAETASDGEARVAQEPYSAAAPGDAIDCATNKGGACFDLQGDEWRAVALVQDENGSAPVRARLDVLDATGNTLEYAVFCDSTALSLEPGAAKVVTTIYSPSAGGCDSGTDIPTTSEPVPLPGVTTGGTVTMTFDVGSREEEQDPNNGDCVGLDTPPTDVLDDDGRTVRLDVYVLLDGVTEARAREVFAKAQNSYTPLNITLAPVYRAMELNRRTDRNMGAMLADARTRLGRVPEGFDVVHILTEQDMGGNGLVTCIGGVASERWGFGVSEELAGDVPMITGNPPNPVPFWPYGDGTGKVIAHELGHQLGGQHQYANCVEGRADPGQTLHRPCTVMDGSLGMAMNFSVANGALVRSHALRYASLNDHTTPVPPPVVPEVPVTVLVVVVGSAVLGLAFLRQRRLQASV